MWFWALFLFNSVVLSSSGSNNNNSNMGFWDKKGSFNPWLEPHTFSKLTKKKICCQVDFTISADHRVKEKKKKSEKIDEYLDLAWGLKKTVEHEGNSDTCSRCCTWNNPQRLWKKASGIGNQRKNRDNPAHSSVKIG